MKLDGKRIVTRDGRVFHETQTAAGPLRTELEQSTSARGYLIINMIEDGQRTLHFVHSLVAREYLPPRPTPDHEIRHLNGNRFDNRATNLAWGTHAENMADAKAHGTMKAAAALTAARRHIPQMELFDWTLEAARCAHQLDVEAKQKLRAKLERWRTDRWTIDTPKNTSSPQPGEPTTRPNADASNGPPGQHDQAENRKSST